MTRQMKVMRRAVAVSLAVLMLGLLQVSSVAGAAPRPDLLYYGGNGYALVENLFESWDDADSAASSMATRGCASAHLATITSHGEQGVVAGLMVGSERNAWLGGFQPGGESDPADGWEWVTGEPWAYTNWDLGEPNDTPGDPPATLGSEQYLEIYPQGVWNDAPQPDLAKYYVVEFEDCPNAHPKPLEVRFEVVQPIFDTGEFEATGPAVDEGVMCESGTTDLVDFSQKQPTKKFTRLLVDYLFTCDDGTGDFDVSLRVKLFPDGSTTAKWKIVSGTDAYESLIGSGKLVGTPTVPGEEILDVYTGKVKI